MEYGGVKQHPDFPQTLFNAATERPLAYESHHSSSGLVGRGSRKDGEIRGGAIFVLSFFAKQKSSYNLAAVQREEGCLPSPSTRPSNWPTSIPSLRTPTPSMACLTRYSNFVPLCGTPKATIVIFDAVELWTSSSTSTAQELCCKPRVMPGTLLPQHRRLQDYNACTGDGLSWRACTQRS